jgi:hypothetical protein
MNEKYFVNFVYDRVETKDEMQTGRRIKGCRINTTPLNRKYSLSLKAVVSWSEKYSHFQNKFEFRE